MSRFPGKNGTEVISILTRVGRNDRGITDGIQNLHQANIRIRSLSNEILDGDPTDAACKILILDQTQNVPKFWCQNIIDDLHSGNVYVVNIT
ncbi:hypothetical protein HNY73_014066 [Argiope bruennichi]|uniref:Uncharacterized protein n=1 Tax=Argiope bruennichi TaxID=94029 RepID=A0A8T0ET09_ARGBR|nr:hypothetical protein HNY73_014066 [Argiope bruennichi]